MPRSCGTARATVSVTCYLTLLPARCALSASPLPRRDELGDRHEFGVHVGRKAGVVEARGGGGEAAVGLLLGPLLAAGRDDQVSGAHQVILGQLIGRAEQVL